jgi:hypothetical protein
MLERVRKICMSFPDAVEKEAWGTPTWRVKNRQFAMFTDNHHGDQRTAVWCNVPEGMQQDLVASNPDAFFVPPYVGPSGWVGVRVDRKLDWKTVAAIIGEAYEHTLAKATRKRLVSSRAKRGSPRR